MEQNDWIIDNKELKWGLQKRVRLRMTLSMTILLDSPVGVYYPGQIINGQLQIYNPEKLQCESK